MKNQNFRYTLFKLSFIIQIYTIQSTSTGYLFIFIRKVFNQSLSKNFQILFYYT